MGWKRNAVASRSRRGLPFLLALVAGPVLVPASLFGAPALPAAPVSVSALPVEKVEAKPADASSATSTAAIVKLLIARSIAAYPGPCACPYQSARNGSSCGKRAAYVRPRGHAPLCYATDVTPEMIAAYRAGR